MKYLAKKLCMALIAAAAVSPAVHGAQARNIFTYSLHSPSFGERSSTAEDAFIVRLDKVSSVIKYYRECRPGQNREIYTAGIVLNIDPEAYTEISYGRGRDFQGRPADYYNLELTNESPGFIFGAGLKHSRLPSYDYTFLYPFAEYFVNEDTSLWGRLYLIRDSEESYKSAFWHETRYALSSNVKVFAGVTAGTKIIGKEYETSPPDSFTTLSGGFSCKLFSSAELKYILEKTWFRERGRDILNTAVLDIRF